MSITLEKLQSVEEERSERLNHDLAAIARQHDQGKMTARERVLRLIDQGTFQEVDFWADTFNHGETGEAVIPGDGVVAGWGEVNGRPVYVWAQDPALLDGSMAQVHIARIVRVMEKALKERLPIVGIYDTAGLRLHSALMSHNYCSYSTMMKFQTISSGVIPQISLIMGQCVGGAALSAPLADCIIMTSDSYLHLTPVDGDVSREEFGGAYMHAQDSGTCSILAGNEDDCLEKCREILSFLPQNNTETTPLKATQDDPSRIDEEIMDIIPYESYRPFDIRKIITMVADDNNYFEIQQEYAPNLSVGFARFNGRSVGIISNNSMFLGGCENSRSSDKHARFIRFCDCFNLPIVYFADSPGFFPSVEEEHLGILRHGCAIIHATSEATVPKISIMARKIFGGAGLVMPANVCQTDRVVAWPTIERGTMGPEALTAIVWKGRIDRAESEDEKKKIFADALPIMKKLVVRQSKVGNEESIDPRQTRKFIIQALKSTMGKKVERPARKHENINL